MIRFVVGPDRALVPDLAATLPGRGIWLSARAGCDRNRPRPGTGLGRAFARAARGPVMVPPDLPAVLEAALIRRIGELLGLARRAGQAVAGFDKAREWLRTGRGGLILQAADGSAAERARFLSGAADAVPVSGPSAGCGAWAGCSAVTMWCMWRWRPAGWPSAIAIEAARLAGLTTGVDGGLSARAER